MIQRLRSLWGSDQDEPEYDAIWIQRQTYKGGWDRQYPNTAFDGIPERPENDDDLWVPGKGRFRAITRVDNHYGDVLWEYKTADADELYDERREEHRRDQQRERLEGMSLEEVEAEWEGDTNHLDLVSEYEIGERYLELMKEQQEEQRQPEKPAEPIEQQKALLGLKALESEAFIEQYGEDIALSVLTDSTSGHSGKAEGDTHPFANLMAEMTNNPDQFEDFVGATGAGLGNALREFGEASNNSDAKFSMPGDTQQER